MSEENIVQVKGNYKIIDEVFTLDKTTGLVTYTNNTSHPFDVGLVPLWNEALQWLPVKGIINISDDDNDLNNYLTLELTTGEVVRLCDDGRVAGEKYKLNGEEYLSIGEW